MEVTEYLGACVSTGTMESPSGVVKEETKGTSGRERFVEGVDMGILGVTARLDVMAGVSMVKKKNKEKQKTW